jgi:hypothetical protein
VKQSFVESGRGVAPALKDAKSPQTMPELLVVSKEDGRHAKPRGGRERPVLVVHEKDLPGFDLHSLDEKFVDPAVGFADADLMGEHAAREQLQEAVPAFDRIHAFRHVVRQVVHVVTLREFLDQFPGALVQAVTVDPPEQLPRRQADPERVLEHLPAVAGAVGSGG